MDKVRIDKWLWAARFFKTRNIAKQAVEGGKVQINGQRVKPSRELEVGSVVTVRQGWDDKTVDVLALSDQRRGAPEAQKLYCEQEQSIALREERAAERKAGLGAFIVSEHKPNKKQRRQIHRFRQNMGED
ncbi:S4 domain-containing protein [Gilvimarinus sp. SDUM040013]|uniref:Heat shock protein 15 n=1 Tax=Gilvimarinus gilvus TaxID=3058038 RepID=A0ABU4RXE9_9GAMM|nr:S4 domain-containing protein [Gilvimarinus sp. SDUM040013]MDO3388643.1 S4 domain-containing protein [Gilvimarinus sp. SDUM040013]MDX6849538.1 S4 domain-containing protein [Gilvimarinus sp. SDUM040013]